MCVTVESKINTRFNSYHEGFSSYLIGCVVLFSEMVLDVLNASEVSVAYRAVLKNSFSFWDIRAPPAHVVSISIEKCDTKGEWDGYMFFLLGENGAKFNDSVGSCYPWTGLTDKGTLRPEFTNITSKSSSVQLIFSSFTTDFTFTARLQAVPSKGNQTERYSIHRYCCNIECLID